MRRTPSEIPREKWTVQYPEEPDHGAAAAIGANNLLHCRDEKNGKGEMRSMLPVCRGLVRRTVYIYRGKTMRGRMLSVSVATNDTPASLPSTTGDV